MTGASPIPPRKQLSVIVLNYRTPALVADCLATLEPEIDPSQDEVVVVDNASPDGSADHIAQTIHDRGWSHWARLVCSPVNGGFAAGNNVGIRNTNAAVRILLNSDTLVRPDAIGTLIDRLDSDQNIALLGPRLEWPDGEPQISTFRFRTPLTELIAAGRLGWLGRRFPRHVVALELHDRDTRPDWASFACIAIRDEVFQRVGLLDEHYFMYFEDMDYCRRAAGEGFRVGYEPNARVVHLRGGTSEVKKNTAARKRRPAYFYGARSHYFTMWYGRRGWLLANLCWTLGWILAIVRGKSQAVNREWRDIWSGPRSGRPTSLPDPSSSAPMRAGAAHA